MPDTIKILVITYIALHGLGPAYLLNRLIHSIEATLFSKAKFSECPTVQIGRTISGYPLLCGLPDEVYHLVFLQNDEVHTPIFPRNVRSLFKKTFI